MFNYYRFKSDGRESIRKIVYCSVSDALAVGVLPV